MSIAQRWRDMYADKVQELAAEKTKAHELRMRLMLVEGQRSSLFFHLRQACRDLEENHFPQTAAVHRSAMKILEQIYAEQTSIVRSAHPVASDQTSDDGSTKSPAGVQVEEKAGVPQGNPFYSGEWDEVKS